MSLTLTTDDLARCEAASRALLSPLVAPSVDDWRREVNRTMRELLCADHAVFALSDQPHLLYSDDVDTGTAQGYLNYTVAEGALFQTHDAFLNRYLQRRRETGQEVFTEATMEETLRPYGETLRNSPYFNEVIWPGGLRGTMGYIATYAGGTHEAGLQIGFEQPERMSPGEAALPLLRALLPSLKAGLCSLTRFHAHRHALDGVSEALIVFGPACRELHRNPALTRLLSAEPEQERLLTEIRFLAHQIAPLGFLVAGRQGEAAFAPPERVVETRSARYVLRSALTPPGAFDDEASVMISVSGPSGPALPSADVLRERHGLTRREAEVALLLAEGLKNEEVAGRLFISAHTARRHTESVLGKLGLSSRKALALKLMQA